MIDKVIIDTIDSIDWMLVFKLSIAAIIVLVMKKYYDNISSYLMFRANKDLGKNVKILVNGREGFITHYTWRFIYVTLLDTGNEMVIPITKWTNYNWEIYKNGKRKGLPE